MRVIRLADNDFQGVESLVRRIHRAVPYHWEQLLPAWYLVILDPNRTFRFVDALQPVIKQFGYNAQIFSQLAERPDDWWSVRVILQPPTPEKFQWVLWVRHSDDTEGFRYSVVGNMADILWCSFPHLREVWAVACKREYKDIAEHRPRQLFCEAFAEIVCNRRQFMMQHSPLVHLIVDLEKRVLCGTINFELKKPL